MPVHHVKDQADLGVQLESAGDKLVVIDFLPLGVVHVR